MARVCRECGQTIPNRAWDVHRNEDCVPFYEIGATDE